MKNKPNFFFFDNRGFPNWGVGGGGPLLGNFSHIILFFSLITILRLEDSVKMTDADWHRNVCIQYGILVFKMLKKTFLQFSPRARSVSPISPVNRWIYVVISTASGALGVVPFSDISNPSIHPRR